MALLYALLLPGLFLMSRSSVSSSQADATSAMQFPAIWSIMGYLGNWLSFFFLGFFAIYIFTSEFLNRTYRQNVITGLTRADLFIGKILFLILIAIAATAVYVISTLTIGLINSPLDGREQIFDRLYLIPQFSIMCFGYMSLGVFFSIWIRKTAVAVFLYFAYILFFEVLIRWSIHRRIADNHSMDFYPANAFEDLVPMPLSDWAVTKQLVTNSEGIHFLTSGEAIITSISYIIIILCASYLLLKSRDL